MTKTIRRKLCTWSHRMRIDNTLNTNGTEGAANTLEDGSANRVKGIISIILWWNVSALP
jgi:hypothetical protein